MAYRLNKSDGTVLATLLDNDFDTTSCSLTLVGRNRDNYGEALLENNIKLLDNFSSTVPPNNPIEGQLWWKRQDNSGTSLEGNQLFVRSRSLTDASGFEWRSLGPFDPRAQIVQIAIEDNDSPLAAPVKYLALGVVLNNNLKSIFFNKPSTFVAGGTLDISGYVVPRLITTLEDNPTAFPQTGNAIDLFPEIYVGFSSSYNEEERFHWRFEGPTNSGEASLHWNDSEGFAELDGTIAYGARYRDLAERYEADMPLEVGDVVILGGEKEITKSQKHKDDRIFGVISGQPAVRMNSGAGTDDTHPFVALAGRIPCKIQGPIKKGQRLVASSFPGIATVIDNPGAEHIYAIIGRALEDKLTNDIGLVEIAVGVK